MAIDFAKKEKPYELFDKAKRRGTWDPSELDLSEDAVHWEEGFSEAQKDQIMGTFVGFYEGEESVTRTLVPYFTIVDKLEDAPFDTVQEEMFLSTHLMEEAKHTDFFDRYWRTVVNPVEEQLGRGRSSPTEQRWFNDAYDELFERNERAMHRLLEDRSPEAFAEAYAHYHLVIEGILAQTGYYGMQQSFAENRNPELPHLPGLYDGFVHIRQDEGRHVGFGMAKLKSLVSEGQIDPQLLDDTVSELMPLVNEIAASPEEISGDRGVQPEELQRFASEKHLDRMEQIQDASAELPDVETLTKLEGD